MIFRFSSRLCRFPLVVGLGLGLGGFLVTALRADEDVIPAFDPGRYEALWTRSPFGIDTAPLAVAKEGPSFADDLAISGIVRSEGKESIVLVNVRTKEFARATKGEGEKYELLSLKVDRDRRKSWAMIGYEGETAEVRFPEQKTSPVSQKALGSREVAGRNSRETGSRQGGGGGPVSAAVGRDPGGGARGAPAAGSASSASRESRVTPPVSPPRRRVILPRKR